MCQLTHHSRGTASACTIQRRCTPDTWTGYVGYVHRASGTEPLWPEEPDPVKRSIDEQRERENDRYARDSAPRAYRDSMP